MHDRLATLGQRGPWGSEDLGAARTDLGAGHRRELWQRQGSSDRRGLPRSPFRSRLGQQEKARAASLKEISPAKIRDCSWSAFFSALGSARKRMCLACTYPAGTGSFWLPGSQSNKPMRTGKALTEAGLSGEATGLPRGGSSSAAQLVVSAAMAMVISATGIRDEGGQARGTQKESKQVSKCSLLYLLTYSHRELLLTDFFT